MSDRSTGAGAPAALRPGLPLNAAIRGGFFLVLHPTPGRVSCFLSDRVPRRDLTGPARPVGLRGKCPPASACGGCLLLDFAPKAYRPPRAVGSQACRNPSSRLFAFGPPL